MKADEAESMLALHRAGREPEGGVKKAVRYAGGNDTLRRKLAEQAEFDAQLVGVIRSIAPPEDLRQKLRAVGPPEAARAKSHLFHPAVLTAVCGVLLIIGFCVWTVLERMERFPGRENVERMLVATGRMSGTELEAVAASAGAMGDWFYMRGFEGFAVPPEIAGLPAVGSRVLRIDGHPIAQLAVGENSILYVFRAADFGVEVPAEASWRMLGRDEWSAGLRRTSGLCYMVAMRGTKEELEAHLLSLKR